MLITFPFLWEGKRTKGIIFIKSNFIIYTYTKQPERYGRFCSPARTLTILHS